MQSRFTYPLAIVLSGLLFFLACQKSVRFDGGSQITMASIAGRVIDQDKIPVSGAQVEAAGKTVTTDIDGKFQIDNVQFEKKPGYVKIIKAGYFQGSRSFVVNPHTINYVEIALITKNISGSFVAGAGGNISVGNGGTINFPLNSIVTESNNSAYSGTVSVAAYFINPMGPDFGTIMPGSLRALNNSGEERILESFGMMAVELSGSGGQKLQLANGRTATIHFPIPAALVAKAPATIPLWYFDEAGGVWKEEGTATKQGSDYVGTVSHFSFWNCDAPFRVINYTAVIKDKQNRPLPALEVQIIRENSSMGYGFTDEDGKVSGLIPADETLKMVFIDKCQTRIDSMNIGPFSSATNAGTLAINALSPVTVNFTGTVVNCNGVAVANGYVNIFLDGRNHRTEINKGTYSLEIQRCNGNPANAQLTAVDAGANVQSATTTFSISSGGINLGQTSACGVTTSQYINYTFNGVNYSYTAPLDSMLAFTQPGTQTYIQAFSSTRSFGFNFIANNTGTYTMDGLRIYQNNKSYSKHGTMNINITEYGTNPNEFIAGNFSGVVKEDSTINIVTYPINCTFRVKRQ